MGRYANQIIPGMFRSNVVLWAFNSLITPYPLPNIKELIETQYSELFPDKFILVQALAMKGG
jgi:hypothetical protein